MSLIPYVTVEVWAGGGTDKYGDPIPPTLVASVPRCRFAPRRSVLDESGNVVFLSTTAAVYMPPSPPYTPKLDDVLKIDGVDWTVTGTPDVWPLGVEVPVERTT